MEVNDNVNSRKGKSVSWHSFTIYYSSNAIKKICCLSIRSRLKTSQTLPISKTESEALTTTADFV